MLMAVHSFDVLEDSPAGPKLSFSFGAFAWFEDAFVYGSMVHIVMSFTRKHLGAFGAFEEVVKAFVYDSIVCITISFTRKHLGTFGASEWFEGAFLHSSIVPITIFLTRQHLEAFAASESLTVLLLLISDCAYSTRYESY